MARRKRHYTRESRGWARIKRGRWRRVRWEVLKRDGYRCRQCGKAGRLEVHHVVHLEDGGAPYALDNLETRCRPCHFQEHRQRQARQLTPEQLAWASLLRDIRQ